MSNYARLPSSLQPPWPDFVKHDPEFIPQSLIHPLKPLPKYQRELSVGLQAVHLASVVTKIHLLRSLHLAKTAKRAGRVDEVAKADSSEVTVADFAAQAIIIGIVNAAFPDDQFIAEESAEMLQDNGELRHKVMRLVLEAKAIIEASSMDSPLPTSEKALLETIDLGQKGGIGDVPERARTWVLDPIDGTKTYIRGQQYAVCLCLVDEGEQSVAVLGCPNLKLNDEDESGRLVVEETIVDMKTDGGYILSAIKGQGTEICHMDNCCLANSRTALEKFLQVGSQTKTSVANTTSGSTVGYATIKLAFTDSAASPHIDKSIHNAVFEYFSEHNVANGSRRMSKSVVDDSESLALQDIWSMQMKYVVLALRAADAMIRTPPQLDYHAAVWDHAGGQLLLTESGGHLTDANGEAFVLDGKTRRLEHNWGVCATRGGVYSGLKDGKAASAEIHDMVLTKVKEELKRRNTGTS